MNEWINEQISKRFIEKKKRFEYAHELWSKAMLYQLRRMEIDVARHTPDIHEKNSDNIFEWKKEAHAI